VQVSAGRFQTALLRNDGLALVIEDIEQSDSHVPELPEGIRYVADNGERRFAGKLVIQLSVVTTTPETCTITCNSLAGISRACVTLRSSMSTAEVCSRLAKELNVAESAIHAVLPSGSPISVQHESALTSQAKVIFHCCWSVHLTKHSGKQQR